MTETIINTFDENRKLIKTVRAERFTLTAAPGHVLRNKITGTVFRNMVTVAREEDLLNYEEIPA